MRIRRRRGEVAVPCESLGQEQIPGRPVEVCYCRVSQGMEPEEPIESGFSLPGFEGVLRPPL